MAGLVDGRALASRVAAPLPIATDQTSTEGASAPSATKEPSLVEALAEGVARHLSTLPGLRVYPEARKTKILVPPVAIAVQRVCSRSLETAWSG